MAYSTINGQQWNLAYTALYGIFIFVLLPLFITGLVAIPQKKDTARRGFIWLKVALFLMFMGVLLVTIETILIVLLNTRVLASYRSLHSSTEAISRLQDWGYVLLEISYIFTLLSILDVALGIFYCWDIGRRLRTPIQWTAYGFAFVEGILLLAKLGGWESWYTAYYNYINDTTDTVSSPSRSRLTTFTKLFAAFYILLWVAATANFALSITVMVWARRRADHRQVIATRTLGSYDPQREFVLNSMLQNATLVLVASILFWIQCLWGLVSVAIWTIPAKLSPQTWDLIVDAVLGPWLQFIVLVLLFVVGHKRLGGIWSIPQDFGQMQQHYVYADQSDMHRKPEHQFYPLTYPNFQHAGK